MTSEGAENKPERSSLEVDSHEGKRSLEALLLRKPVYSLNMNSESEVLMVPVSFLGRGWAGPMNMQRLPLLQASLVYQPSLRDPLSPQRGDAAVGLGPLHFCLPGLELIFWLNSQDTLNSFLSTPSGLSLSLFFLAAL